MFETRPDRAWPRACALAAAAVLAGFAVPGAAQNRAPPPAPAATFADLADLTEAAALVALVEVRDQAQVEPERAPGLAPGHARLYLEARTLALLAGRAALGESLVYLADVPLDAKGKAPKLKKQHFLVYADPVAGRAGALQLVDPSAQLPATPENEQRARAVVAALAAPDAPPAVTGIRDVMSVPGNLAGESETQLFLDTRTGQPVSLSVVRRPGMAPAWGVSVERDRRPVGAPARTGHRRLVPARLLPPRTASCRRLPAARRGLAPAGRGRLPLHRRAARRLPAHPRLTP